MGAGPGYQTVKAHGIRGYEAYMTSVLKVLNV